MRGVIPYPVTRTSPEKDRRLTEQLQLSARKWERITLSAAPRLVYTVITFRTMS
jgi:hypothetical protein